MGERLRAEHRERAHRDRVVRGVRQLRVRRLGVVRKRRRVVEGRRPAVRAGERRRRGRTRATSAVAATPGCRPGSRRTRRRRGAASRRGAKRRRPPARRRARPSCAACAPPGAGSSAPAPTRAAAAPSRGRGSPPRAASRRRARRRRRGRSCMGLLRRLAVRGETCIRVGLGLRGESAIRAGSGCASAANRRATRASCRRRDVRKLRGLHAALHTASRALRQAAPSGWPCFCRTPRWRSTTSRSRPAIRSASCTSRTHHHPLQSGCRGACALAPASKRIFWQRQSPLKSPRSSSSPAIFPTNSSVLTGLDASGSLDAPPSLRSLASIYDTGKTNNIPFVARSATTTARCRTTRARR